METKKTNENKKIGVNSIKGAIIEIVVSLLVLCGTLIVFFIASQSANGLVDTMELLLICAFASIFFLLDGIITIPYVIKQKRIQKNKENLDKKDTTME